MREAPPSRPVAHDGTDAHEDGGLPVAFSGEAPAVLGREALRANARQLRQSARSSKLSTPAVQPLARIMLTIAASSLAAMNRESYLASSRAGSTSYLAL